MDPNYDIEGAREWKTSFPSMHHGVYNQTGDALESISIERGEIEDRQLANITKVIPTSISA
jgi:hypothetical protein